MIIPASKLLFRLVGALAAAFALLFALTAWRLSSGPISLAFLTPYLAEALTLGEAGFSAEIDDTILAWGGWERNLEIRAQNVRLRRADGTQAAAVPEVLVSLNGRALLEGRIAPQEVDLIGVSAKLTRNKDGRFDFGLISRDEDGANANLLALLIAELSKPTGTGVIGNLTRASILDAKLSLVDETTGTEWVSPKTRLVLWRKERGLLIDFDADIDLDGSLAKLVALGNYDLDQQGIGLRFAFNDLTPKQLAGKLPLPDEVKGFDLPVSGSIGFSLDREGHFSAIDYDVNAGRGTIAIPALRPTPYEVRAVAVRGKIKDQFDGLSIEAGTLDLGDTKISLLGQIEKGDGNFPKIDLSGIAPRLPVEALPKYWPPAMASEARRWVANNIAGGSAEDMNFRVSLSPDAIETGKLRPESIVLDFKFSNLAVQYLPDFPKMTGARGHARLNTKQFDLTVDDAEVSALKVGESNLLIVDLDQSGQTAAIDLTLRGAAKDALALIDLPPFGLAQQLGFTPETVGGQTGIRARFTIPLSNNIHSEQVEISAAANIKDAKIAKLYDRFDFADGDLTLAVNKQRLELKGTAKLNQTSARIAWSESFDKAAPFPSHYQIAATLDNEGRRQLGLDLSGFVDGPTPFEAEIDIGRANDLRARVKADLKPTTLNFSDIFWSKASDLPAELIMEFTGSTRGVMALPLFQLRGHGISAHGSAMMTAGHLTAVKIDDLRYGQNTLSATADQGSNGAWRIAARGASFDLRPYFDHFLETTTPPSEMQAPIEMTAQFDRLILSDDQSIEAFNVAASRQGERWYQIDAQGKLGGKAPLHLSVEPEGTLRKLHLSSEDAGGVIRTLKISSSVIGGVLDISGMIRDDLPDAPIEGALRIDTFKLVNAPLMARVLNVGSFTGIGELLSGEGIAFARAEVPFSYRGGYVKTAEARAWGSAMGFTSSGTADLVGGDIHLTGTIVPSYTINTILGYIPLLGKILTNREGEGIFGATYQIAGAIGEPKITVNGLSALAPGILRRMFEPNAPDIEGLPPVRPEQIQPESGKN